MASKIVIISNALILAGDLPINTLDGNSRVQVIASSIYESILNEILSIARWGFARKVEQLSKLVEKPKLAQWKSIYQLPSDLITLIRLDSSLDYQIYGDKIYTNASQSIFADYVYRPEESLFPEYFVKTLEYSLAKSFAYSIRDSSSAGDRLLRDYNISLSRSLAIDSQQSPSRPISHRPFIDVRF